MNNMSLLPVVFEFEQPRRHDYISLTPDDLLSLINAGAYRTWNQIQDTSCSIKNDSGKFQINLDVQQYAPDEIFVKTVDRFVVIEGRHAEKRDEHGWVSRQFTRRYALPDGCSPEAVQSLLSLDGVLTVSAPLEPHQTNERIVPIIPTGPVRPQTGDPGVDGALIPAEKH